MLAYVLGLFLLCTARVSHAAVPDSTKPLNPRQSSVFDPSEIPSACQGACTSVVDNANTCTTFQCLCTPKNNVAVLACVNCVISFNHTGPVIIDGQDILNQFASECNLNNVSVSSLSASGVATVTGITTSNLNPPPTSAASSQASASQSASATSPPSVSAPSASTTPSTTPSGASSIYYGARFSLLSSCAAVAILVGLTMA